MLTMGVGCAQDCRNAFRLNPAPSHFDRMIMVTMMMMMVVVVVMMLSMVIYRKTPFTINHTMVNFWQL